MTPFTLATLRTPTGPRAAIEVASRYYVLEDVFAGIPDPTCKSLLQTWDVALPLLRELADSLTGQPGLDLDGISLLTPVIYPDKVLAVGANYSGHLKEMGLAVRKWDSMPFFVRPPSTTLVGPGRPSASPARPNSSTGSANWPSCSADRCATPIGPKPPLPSRPMR